MLDAYWRLTQIATFTLALIALGGIVLCVLFGLDSTALALGFGFGWLIGIFQMVNHIAGEGLARNPHGAQGSREIDIEHDRKMRHMVKKAGESAMKYRIREAVLHAGYYRERAFIAERQCRFLWLFKIWLATPDAYWRRSAEEAKEDIEHDKKMRKPLSKSAYYED